MECNLKSFTVEFQLRSPLKMTMTLLSTLLFLQIDACLFPQFSAQQFYWLSVASFKLRHIFSPKQCTVELRYSKLPEVVKKKPYLST